MYDLQLRNVLTLQLCGRQDLVYFVTLFCQERVILVFQVFFVFLDKRSELLRSFIEASSEIGGITAVIILGLHVTSSSSKIQN